MPTPDSKKSHYDSGYALDWNEARNIRSRNQFWRRLFSRRIRKTAAKMIDAGVREYEDDNMLQYWGMDWRIIKNE